jgi:hypothetical protein
MVGNGKWTETLGKQVFMELESGRARPKDGERRGEREKEKGKNIPGREKVGIMKTWPERQRE